MNTLIGNRRAYQGQDAAHELRVLQILLRIGYDFYVVFQVVRRGRRDLGERRVSPRRYTQEELAVYRFRTEFHPFLMALATLAFTPTAHAQVENYVALALNSSALGALPISRSQTTTYDGLGYIAFQTIPNATVIDDISYDNWYYDDLVSTSIVPQETITYTSTSPVRSYTSDGSNLE